MSAGQVDLRNVPAASPANANVLDKRPENIFDLPALPKYSFLVLVSAALIAYAIVVGIQVRIGNSNFVKSHVLRLIQFQFLISILCICHIWISIRFNADFQLVLFFSCAGAKIIRSARVGVARRRV